MGDIAIAQFTVHNGMCWGSQRGELHGILMKMVGVNG